MAGDVDVLAERPGSVSRSPIVETASGRIAGATTDGVHVFKGIHYGADTGGTNRFQPPRPMASRAAMRCWSAVARAMSYRRSRR